MVTKLFRRPLEIMAHKVDQFLNPTTEKTKLDHAKEKVKYMIYSAHDVQVESIIVQLKPTNDFNHDNCPFASSFTMELKYDSECLTLQKSEECFTVSLLYNGIALAFDDCPIGCTYPQFLMWIISILYGGLDNYSYFGPDEACDHDYRESLN